MEERHDRLVDEISVESGETRTETPEQQYIKAYKEDKGFRSYIDNMKVRRNNPGNLRFHNQPGATNDNGFASFKTPHEGFRALIKQLKMDISRGDTIQTFIYDYAPSSENDTYKYMLFLEEACGHRDTKLEDIDILLFATKIVEFEHSYRFN